MTEGIILFHFMPLGRRRRSARCRSLFTQTWPREGQSGNISLASLLLRFVFFLCFFIASNFFPLLSDITEQHFLLM